MIKLLRYLKPYAVWLVVAALLLFGQAMCDLNLPNYMSKIVNIGLQQGGVEHASPDAIGADALEFEKTFMTSEQRELVETWYTAPEPGSEEAEKAAGQYPLLEEKNGLLLGEIPEADREALDLAFGGAAWTFINTMKSMGTAGGMSAGMDLSAEEIDVSAVDWEQLYAMQPLFSALPEETLEAARAEALTNDSSLLTQTGAALARGFYEELGVDTDAMQTLYILRIGLYMLAITFLGGAATVLVGLLGARISSGVSRTMRADLFRKVESFSNAEFDRFSTSSLITRTTNDITQVQMLIMMGIRMLCYAPIMGVGGVIMAIGKSTSMTWIIALACIVLIGLILVIFSVVIPKFKLVQKLVDRLNLVARENLNGLLVIRAFGTQEYEKDRFGKVNRDLTRTQRFTSRAMACMMPAMMLIMNGTTLLIVWVGAHQIAQSTMQVGDMMAFMQYAMQIIMSFLAISMMFIMVPGAAVSGDRIQAVLEAEPVVRDPEQPRSPDVSKAGVVEFRNVSFRYAGADEDVLHDISFTALPGQTTAIIGSTGSGKSTLINLIPRFYDVTDGEIRIGGVDVREMSQKELHESIGYVPQKGVLLSGTIASNLRYGAPDASDEEIRTAAEVAQAVEFIDEKPEGMESPIAQGGTNVSGGQKQRLSIARALAKKPPIFIFDDSFSALDFKTDAALRRALKQHTGHSTVLIVAQRVSTIMYADQILVLHEGQLVGKGTHRELLHNCPEYYEIAASQMTQEELQ